MSPKDYLNQYRLIDMRINAKLEQVARLRDLATKVTPSQSDCGGSNGATDKLGNIVAKICDMEVEINAEIDTLIDLKRVIESTIAKVDDITIRQLLTLRYINCKTWEQIAVDMHYTYRNVLYLHGRALHIISLFFTSTL